MAVLLELDDDDVVERRPLSVARVDEAEVDVNRQALGLAVVDQRDAPEAVFDVRREPLGGKSGVPVHKRQHARVARAPVDAADAYALFLRAAMVVLGLDFDKRQARADVFACPYFLPDAAEVMVHQIHASVRSVEVDGAIRARPHAVRLLSPVVRLQHRQQHFELAFGRDVFRVNPVHQPDFGHLRKADAGKGRQQSVDFLKIHVCLTFLNSKLIVYQVSALIYSVLHVT